MVGKISFIGTFVANKEGGGYIEIQQQDLQDAFLRKGETVELIATPKKTPAPE